MKIEKVDICMKAVQVIKDTAKNFGMVCKNCKNLAYKNKDNEGYCAVIDKDIDLEEDFCKDFYYRDDDACEDLWQKSIKKIADENVDILGYSE